MVTGSHGREPTKGLDRLQVDSGRVSDIMEFVQAKTWPDPWRGQKAAEDPLPRRLFLWQ